MGLQLQSPSVLVARHHLIGLLATADNDCDTDSDPELLWY